MRSESALHRSATQYQLRLSSSATKGQCRETLLPGSASCDFSTAAGNSALIIDGRNLRDACWLPRIQKNNNEISRHIRLAHQGGSRHVTEKAHQTTIRCCHCCHLGSTDSLALHPRRLRRRQAIDRALGSLGARRQQELD